VQRDGRKTKDWVLREVKMRLKRWFFMVLKMDCTDAERRLHWQGAVEHLTRDGSGWNHTPEAVEQLRGFIGATMPLFDRIQTRFSTQLSECVNSMKGKLASKSTSWKVSWTARICVVILNFNEGHMWKLGAYDNLRGKFGWPELPEQARERLASSFQMYDRLAMARGCPAKAANEKRLLFRSRGNALLSKAVKSGEALYEDGRSVEALDPPAIAEGDDGKLIVPIDAHDLEVAAPGALVLPELVSGDGDDLFLGLFGMFNWVDGASRAEPARCLHRCHLIALLMARFQHSSGRQAAFRDRGAGPRVGRSPTRHHVVSGDAAGDPDGRHRGGARCSSRQGQGDRNDCHERLGVLRASGPRSA
jgi:hypothetical protein